MPDAWGYAICEKSTLLLRLVRNQARFTDHILDSNEHAVQSLSPRTLIGS
jgi:hypothetical protein